MSTGTTPSSFGSRPLRTGSSGERDRGSVTSSSEPGADARDPAAGSAASVSSAAPVYVTLGSQSRNSSMPAALAASICARTSGSPYWTPSEKSWSHGTTRAPVPRTMRRKSTSDLRTIA